MDFYTKFPLAKRTRSNIERFLVDQHLERRKMKMAKKSGDGVTGAPVECLDSDSDGDLVRVGKKKGESLKSRKCLKRGDDFVNNESGGRSRKGRKLGKKLKKDFNGSGGDLEIVYDYLESPKGGKFNFGGDDEVECSLKKGMNVFEFDEEVRDLSMLKREEVISDLKVVSNNRGRKGGKLCDLVKKGKKKEGDLSMLKSEEEISNAKVVLNNRVRNGGKFCDLVKKGKKKEGDLSKWRREEGISDVNVVLDNRGRNGGKFSDFVKKGKIKEKDLKSEVEVSDDRFDSEDGSDSGEEDVGDKDNVCDDRLVSDNEKLGSSKDLKDKMDVDEEYVSSDGYGDNGIKGGVRVESRNVEKKNGGVPNGNDEEMEVFSVSDDLYTDSSSSEDVNGNNSSRSDHEDEDFNVEMDEGKDDDDDDDDDDEEEEEEEEEEEKECKTRNKSGVERKVNEKTPKGGHSGRKSNRKEKQKRVQDSYRVEQQGVASCMKPSLSSKSGSKNVNARKTSHPHHAVEEVLDVTSDSEDDLEVISVSEADSSGDDVGKQPHKSRGGKILGRLKILADSLCDEEEGKREKFDVEPKSIYRFSFGDEDPKPEKSEFEKEVDQLFAQLTMCLAFEEIGSGPSEVNNDDPTFNMQTDGATLCSQGSHLLILDEQIGIVCKRCSYVHTEIKYILPSFSKSPERRERSYFVHERCATYADHFDDSGAEHHDYEDNNYKRGTVWDLIPGTRSSMYEHQREGFEFIWMKLAGDIKIDKLEKPLSSSGGGCIISHAPGTGKTRLTVCFLHSFMRMYPDSRPVVIAPRTMLHTWEAECKKWNVDIPFHNMNKLELSGQENAAAAGVYFLKKERRSINKTRSRLVKLWSWKKDKSILGISYRLFEKLVGDEEQMGRALIKLPTLLILDEGHTPRNEKSHIYKYLSKVETKRRIILSGTPFQNNFRELHNTLCLVNPEFGRKSSGATEKYRNSKKMNEESKSKWASLTKFNGDSDHIPRELRDMIDPLVHVHEGTILHKKIPALRDTLILLRPTDLQQELMTLLKSNERKIKYFEYSGAISLVSVHPSLLPESWLEDHLFSAYRKVLKKEEKNPYSGVKTKFVLELCRLSEALDERVLVFGQFIDPLVFLKNQLLAQFKWTEGKEVLYMDGNLNEKKRQLSITSLNDPSSKARVLLASTKACSEGINLVGASRVVLLDIVWNPSVERQAISRAYRLGQKKIVYTYHLMAGSMDVHRYRQQSEKDRWSELIFSSKDMDSRKEKMKSIVSEDKILEGMFQHNDKLGHMFDDIVYQPKESDSLVKLMTAKNS